MLDITPGTLHAGSEIAMTSIQNTVYICMYRLIHVNTESHRNHIQHFLTLMHRHSITCMIQVFKTFAKGYVGNVHYVHMHRF